MTKLQFVLWMLAAIAFALAAWRPIFRTTVHLGWVGAVLIAIATLL